MAETPDIGDDEIKNALRVGKGRCPNHYFRLANGHLSRYCVKCGAKKGGHL